MILVRYWGAKSCLQNIEDEDGHVALSAYIIHMEPSRILYVIRRQKKDKDKDAFTEFVQALFECTELYNNT